MSYDPRRLGRELLAAGLSSGCRSDPRPDQVAAGLPPERWAIDWPAPPTPAQLATAADILRLHDPDGDRKEDAADSTALDTALSALGTGTAAQRLDRVEAILWRVVSRLRKRGGA